MQGGDDGTRRSRSRLAARNWRAAVCITIATPASAIIVAFIDQPNVPVVSGPSQLAALLGSPLPANSLTGATPTELGQIAISAVLDASASYDPDDTTGPLAVTQPGSLFAWFTPSQPTAGCST